MTVCGGSDWLSGCTGMVVCAQLDTDTASIKAFGLDVVTDLCDRLRSAGVPALHFYTMNQSAATLEICRRLGI